MAAEMQSPRVAPGVREHIAALVAEHWWLIDHGQADRIASLYTQDGRLLGLGEDVVGQDALAAWGARRAAMSERTSRHVCTNLRLTADADGRIRGTVLLTLYRHDGASKGPASPLLIGDFEDLYEHCPDGNWRFAERRFVPVFGA